jgi:hypothetical protein
MSLNIIRIAKFKGLRWTGNVARMEERKETRIFGGSHGNSDDGETHGRITLIWVPEKWVMRAVGRNSKTQFAVVQLTTLSVPQAIERQLEG